jgi:hypothetical protein
MEGTVAGWGKTDNSFGKTGTNILNKVQVPIIDNRKCKRWHKEKVSRLHRFGAKKVFAQKTL